MLRVIVVGAGIAGLSAAISLRRAGHAVHIYERSSMNNEVGAAINVPPNVSRFLVPWGLDPIKARFVKSASLRYIDPMTMEPISNMGHGGLASMYGAEFYYAHRVDLHDNLKRMAVEEDGVGIPVVIHLDSEVVKYDADMPSVTLANGEVITGDVIVGADGVHSIATAAVIGRPSVPQPPSHYNCCYRFLIPAATLEEDPETQFWNEDSEGVFRILAHNEASRRLAVYPCRDNTIHNFVGIFYDEAMKSVKKEDYMASVEKSILLDKFAGFHPKLLAVISKATEVKRWPLLYRAPLPSWKKGKLVLAGDAAHPMLPHQGQGGAQGLEDGMALGLVLHGATKSDVETRLDLYGRIRRNRASAIQILSNAGQDQVHLVRDELLQYVKEEDMPTDIASSFRFNFNHDVVRATIAVMKEYDASYELPQGFFQDGSPYSSIT